MSIIAEQALKHRVQRLEEEVRRRDVLFRHVLDARLQGTRARIGLALINTSDEVPMRTDDLRRRCQVSLTALRCALCRLRKLGLIKSADNGGWIGRGRGTVHWWAA